RADELRHRLRRLRALLEPCLELVGLELDEGGGPGGVVEANLLDVAPVAGRFRMRHDDTVHRLLFAAMPGQADLDHGSPFARGTSVSGAGPGTPACRPS